MPRAAKGYIEQLPSGSFRVTVYVGTDPLTGRAIRLKATAKTEQQARIELGRLLKDASEGRTPESVATLLEEYALVAPWDVSTRQTNEGFIRRTIKPALGHIEVRKVRGPILEREHSRPVLQQRLRTAQLAGHDISAIIGQITAAPMAGARSISSVLHSCLQQLTLPDLGHSVT
jgi:hypothetical protein